MEEAKKIYQRFIQKYPDVFERRGKIMEWCLKTSENNKVALQVWKYLDMFEEEGE